MKTSIKGKEETVSYDIRQNRKIGKRTWKRKIEKERRERVATKRR